MTAAPGSYEVHVLTPYSVVDAMLVAANGDDAAQCVLVCLAETLQQLRRKRKQCMLTGCGHWCGVGKPLPAAFCIMLPMFPRREERETAVSSPICWDCYRKPDLVGRLKETLAGDFECTVFESAAVQ